MTAPTVTPLTTAPSRLARPSNFSNESAILLDRLPNFREQLNTLSNYINQITLNKYDSGRVDGLRTMPTSIEMPDEVDESASDIDFTSDIDLFLNVNVSHSRNVNNLSRWFDSLVQEHGVIDYDHDLPLISAVSPAMTRGQNRGAFNLTATKYAKTMRDSINSFHYRMWYTYITCCSIQDAGLVDESITLIEDDGLVNDLNIEGKV